MTVCPVKGARRGLTLIEMIIAAGLMAAISIPTALFFREYARLVYQGNVAGMLAAIAERDLTIAKTTAWTDATLAPGYVGTPPYYTETAFNDSRFDLVRSVETVPNTGNAIRRIRLELFPAESPAHTPADALYRTASWRADLPCGLGASGHALDDAAEWQHFAASNFVVTQSSLRITITNSDPARYNKTLAGFSFGIDPAYLGGGLVAEPTVEKLLITRIAVTAPGTYVLWEKAAGEEGLALIPGAVGPPPQNVVTIHLQKTLPMAYNVNYTVTITFTPVFKSGETKGNYSLNTNHMMIDGTTGANTTYGVSYIAPS